MAGGWLTDMLGKSTSVSTAVTSGRTPCFPPFALSRNCTRFLYSARNALLQISMGSGVDCADLSDVAVNALKEAEQCSLAMNASLTSQLDFDPSYRIVQSRDYLYNAFFIIPIIQNHSVTGLASSAGSIHRSTRVRSGVSDFRKRISDVISRAKLFRIPKTHP